MKHNTDLGQHFMVDTDVLKKIVSTANIGRTDRVLEVGSGDGALTRYLRKASVQVTTVEIDTRYPADIHGNILDLIEDLEFSILVSNLPYHISEPLFVKLLHKRPESITVVVGNAFAQHLQSDSILGTVFREVYEVEYVCEIPPESFDPPPRVLSALIRCVKRDKIGVLSDYYEYPKSKVKNYLKTKTTKKEAQEFINKLPLPLIEKRLYELSVKEFQLLASVVRQIEQ